MPFISVFLYSDIPALCGLAPRIRNISSSQLVLHNFFYLGFSAYAASRLSPSSSPVYSLSSSTVLVLRSLLLYALVFFRYLLPPSSSLVVYSSINFPLSFWPPQMLRRNSSDSCCTPSVGFPRSIHLKLPQHCHLHRFHLHVVSIQSHCENFKYLCLVHN